MINGIPETFLGMEQSGLEEANVIVLPVPYGRTVSYKTGTEKGPKAIIEASRQMETFDIETQMEVSGLKFLTLPAIAPLVEPAQMIQAIRKSAEKIIENRGFFIMLGGDHSISHPAVEAFHNKYPKLTVLQIDAHFDLRDTYEGSRHAHACVMRRIRDTGISTVQMGIRSTSEEEQEYIKANNIKNIFYGFRAEDIPEITASLGSEVYITLDIDAFDPSIAPGTGTPVHGGMLWEETLGLLKEVFSKKNVVGMDCVEVLPISYQNTITEDLAAQTLLKCIAYKFKNE